MSDLSGEIDTNKLRSLAFDALPSEVAILDETGTMAAPDSVSPSSSVSPTLTGGRSG